LSLKKKIISFLIFLKLPIQNELLRICRVLIEKCQHQLEPYAYRIFKCILSLLSIVENDELRAQV
jgi:hypothetical protein